MRLKILGSAAGGGFPQWNCGCSNCSRQRLGRLNAVSRSQIQVAITSDDQHWFLLNASPDLRTQIEETPELHPRGLRHTPVAGVVLTAGDIDQVLGLLLMRELQPIRIFATDAVREIVQRDNAFFNMLTQHEGQSRWVGIKPGQAFTLSADNAPSLSCSPVSVGSGFPRYVPASKVSLLSSEEAVLGLFLQQSHDGPRLGYFPTAGKVTPEMIAALDECDLVLFDGTFWDDDELARVQGCSRTAREMGHIPIGGDHGSLAALASLRRPRKILVHINNTNPILDRDSVEHRQVREAGWEVAEDGWDIQL